MPLANLASYISDHDYPLAAIRRNASGTVTFRLHIGADGRVANCATAISSGDRDLDAASCEVMTERARFEPAIGADGAPVAAAMVARIRWIIPR